ncbi:hypothetical protein ACFX2J_009055 [Malus domestica]
MPVAERRSIGTMENSMVENGVCSSESANGNCDVWSSEESESSSADHLVIMIHGIMVQVVLSNGIMTAQSPLAQIPFDPFGSFNVSNGSAPTRPETELIRDIHDPKLRKLVGGKSPTISQVAAIATHDTGAKVELSESARAGVKASSD